MLSLVSLMLLGCEPPPPPVPGTLERTGEVVKVVNGQNVNGANEPDFLNGPINLDNVERVEVVVGPSSLFQQANTLAAPVNVITQDAEGIKVIGAAGNDLRYSATVMTGRRWTKDKLLSFSYTTEASSS